jgi:RNA-binding protein
VHVGHHGVTDAVRQTIDDALRTKELVKIQFSKNFETRPKKIAGEVAELMGAEVVQAIGRTITLFRENPELHE